MSGKTVRSTASSAREDGAPKQDGRGVGRPRRSGKGTRKSRGTSKPSSTRNRVRGLERLLAHKGDSMSRSARAQMEAEVASLKALAEERGRREAERKLAKKYHMVKFFERRKAERRLEHVRALLGKEGVGKDAELLRGRETDILRDLAYIKHFPKDKPYVALYPSNGHTERSRALVEDMRKEVEEYVSKCQKLDSGQADDIGVAKDDRGDGHAARVPCAMDDDFFMGQGEP